MQLIPGTLIRACFSEAWRNIYFWKHPHLPRRLACCCDYVTSGMLVKNSSFVFTKLWWQILTLDCTSTVFKKNNTDEDIEKSFFNATFWKMKVVIFLNVNVQERAGVWHSHTKGSTNNKNLLIMSVTVLQFIRDTDLICFTDSEKKIFSPVYKINVQLASSNFKKSSTISLTVGCALTWLASVSLFR